MEVTIFVAIFAFTVVLTVLFHKLPSDREAIYHGARVQKIGLGILGVVSWLVLSLLGSTIDYLYSNGSGIVTYTLQTIYLTYIFFAVGIYFALMTFLTFLEHTQEETEVEDGITGAVSGGLLGE